MTEPFKHDPQWAKSKQVCRLSMEDIRMAKSLGMSPKTLMKNNPSPSQRWKLPVKHWIHDLYEKRFGRDPEARIKPSQLPKRPAGAEPEGSDGSIPF